MPHVDLVGGVQKEVASAMGTEGQPVPIIVDAEGKIWVQPGITPVSANGEIDAGNSSITPLGIDGVFTGIAKDMLDTANVSVFAYSDVASADGGLMIEWSTDAINWDENDTFSIPAGDGKIKTFGPATQYMRVVYTNGAIAQTAFRLQIICKGTSYKPSSHEIEESISAGDDAELVKAVITAENGDGNFHNIKSTSDGNLTISDNSDGLAIAEGNVTGKTFIHKFGKAPDFDPGDGFVTIWDGSEDAVVWEKMLYTYSATADIDTISSENNGDTQDMEILGLDANYDLVTQTKTLTGQTPVLLDTNLIRVFRILNVGSVDLVGHVFCFVSGGTVTAGVPQVPADIRAIIQPGNNQTLMSILTIPNGKTGYMRDWYASTAGAKKTSVHEVKIFARPFGQVFQLKHDSSLFAAGTSDKQHKYEEPEKFLEKTDIEMRCNTDEDNAAISGGFDIVLVDN